MYDKDESERLEYEIEQHYQFLEK